MTPFSVFIRLIFYSVVLFVTSLLTYFQASTEKSKLEFNNKTEVRTLVPLAEHFFKTTDTESDFFRHFLFECFVESNEIQETETDSPSSGVNPDETHLICYTLPDYIQTQGKQFNQHSKLAHSIGLYILYCNRKVAQVAE